MRRRMMLALAVLISAVLVFGISSDEFCTQSCKRGGPESNYKTLNETKCHACCSNKTSCGTCLTTSLAPTCGWCESTLTCGGISLDKVPEDGWMCPTIPDQDEDILPILHKQSECSARPPTIRIAYSSEVSEEPVDGVLAGVPTDGSVGLVLQLLHAGTLAPPCGLEDNSTACQSGGQQRITLGYDDDAGRRSIFTCSAYGDESGLVPSWQGKGHTDCSTPTMKPAACPCNHKWDCASQICEGAYPRCGGNPDASVCRRLDDAIAMQAPGWAAYACEGEPYITFVCDTLPGIGNGRSGDGYDIQVHVRGSERSRFEDRASSNHSIRYAAPVLTGVRPATQLAAFPRGQGSGGSGVVGKRGQALILSGRNFAPSKEVARTWEAAARKWDARAAAAMEVHFGEIVAKVNSSEQSACGVIDSTEACVIVPPGNGINLPLSVMVGGQKMTGPARFHFSFSGAAIEGVSPLFGPSAGGSFLTITGHHFGKIGVATLGSVRVHLIDQHGTKTPCEVGPTMWADTQIVCLQHAVAPTGDVDYTVQVGLGPKGNEEEQVVTYQKSFTAVGCNKTCLGGTCDASGGCICSAQNFVNYSNSTQMTGVPLVGCTCGLSQNRSQPAAGQPNAGVGVRCYGDAQPNFASCGCTCTEQWQSAPTPVGVRPHSFPSESPALCSDCSLPCTGFLEAGDPVRVGTNCHCEFNKLHLIWMGGALLVCVLIAFMLFRFINKQVIYEEERLSMSHKSLKDALRQPLRSQEEDAHGPNGQGDACPKSKGIKHQSPESILEVCDELVQSVGRETFTTPSTWQEGETPRTWQEGEMVDYEAAGFDPPIEECTEGEAERPRKRSSLVEYL